MTFTDEEHQVFQRCFQEQLDQGRPSDSAALIARWEAEAYRAEMARRDSITALCLIGRVPQWAEGLIERETSPAEVRQMLLKLTKQETKQ